MPHGSPHAQLMDQNNQMAPSTAHTSEISSHDQPAIVISTYALSTGFPTLLSLSHQSTAGMSTSRMCVLTLTLNS